MEHTMNAFLPIVMVLAGCDAWLLRANFEPEQDAILYEADSLSEAPVSLSQLNVLNYNIKYGGGRLLFFWECDGDRYNMTEEEVTAHLDAVIDFIKWHDPDILLLQEVDRNSLRSAYIDQVQYILDRTELNYGAYAAQHRVDFLPTDGFGYLDFGNAILTRWPITKATRIALPLVESYPAYYRYLYLKRHVLTSQIELPWNDTFYAINTHLEAFSEGNTKKEQIDVFHEVLLDLNDKGHEWVAGGDLNSLPKGSEMWSDFPDDCPGLFEPDDYSGEEDWLDPLFNDFSSAMSLDGYATDNSQWFSYTGNPNKGWTRTLDYLFTNGVWANNGDNNLVIQSVTNGGYDTLMLSDHAPVQATLEVSQ